MSEMCTTGYGHVRMRVKVSLRYVTLEDLALPVCTGMGLGAGGTAICSGVSTESLVSVTLE